MGDAALRPGTATGRENAPSDRSTRLSQHHRPTDPRLPEHSAHAPDNSCAMKGAVDTRGVQFWCMATRALIAMIPPVLLALLAQRYIVRGLTLGAEKG